MPTRDDEWSCTVHLTRQHDFYICFHQADLRSAEVLMNTINASGSLTFLDRTCLQHLYIANKGWRRRAAIARMQGLYCASVVLVLVSPVRGRTRKKRRRG